MQVAPEGAPVQVNATIPVNPPSPLTPIVKVAGEPGARLAEVEDPAGGAKEKSWPIPLSATLSGLPEALSEILSVPVLIPPAAGLKVTEITHVAFALTVFPQVLVAVKSPLEVMLEMPSAPAPTLVRETVCEALLVPDNCAGKVREEVDKLTSGPVPVPDSKLICGLPGALSVNATHPVRVPAAVGVNVIGTWQLAIDASVGGQLLLWAKSPPATMPEMLAGALPKLVTTSVLAALVVPIFCGAKDMGSLGSKSMIGELPVPVPCRITICGLSGALS